MALRTDTDMMKPGANGKILIVVHQERSTPGRVGLMLKDRGYELDIRRPCLGHPLPETLEAHDGVVVFGGPMSANDDCEEFIRREIDWLDVPLKENKPFFGICLGAQLLARHLGADVSRHPEGLVEIGYFPIWPTEPGRHLGPWPDHVYQWHQEGFTLPSGARLIAEGERYPNQAYAYGDNAFGIQFHPELTLAMMYRWTTRGAPRLKLPGAKPRSTHFEDRWVHDRAVRAWLSRFLDRWLAGDAAAEPCAQAAE